MLEFRVVLAGSRSWSWCGSRSWTGAACYRAVLAGGPQCATSRTLLGDPVAVLVVVVVVLEFRVVRAGTAVASYRAALAGGPQCATFRTLLGDPVAVLFLVVVVLEFRVVLAGSRSWSWCGSRSWTGAACYRAVLSGGVVLIASFHIRCNPGAAFSLEDLEFRVVRAGTAVASDWAALAGGPQCATFFTLLGDPVAVLFPVVVVREVRVVLAAKHSSGRKAQHQNCHERPVVTHGKLMPRRPVQIDVSLCGRSRTAFFEAVL